MSWRTVGVVYAVLALLLAVVFVVDRQPVVQPPPPGAAASRSLLGIEPTAVHAVAFRRGDARVRAELVDGRWRTVEPAGATVPSDLFDAAVATLTAGQASEVVADGAGPGDLGAFGLVSPSSTIVLTTDVAATTRDVTVFLGNSNPTHTALYARRADDQRVYLVGLNVRYYEDLIFSAAGA